MYYYVLAVCLIYGIYSAIEEMQLVRMTNKNYSEPKDIVSFLLNEQTK